MRRAIHYLVTAIAVVALAATGCSDDDSTSDSDDTSAATEPTDTDTDTGDDPVGDTDTGDDPVGDTDTGGDPGGDPDELSTAGLVDYLETNYSDEGFAGEVSLLSTGDSGVLVGTQTSFFEPDEAVAFCEAAAEFIYGPAGASPHTSILLESTSGTTVAERASADSDCVAG